MREREQQQGEQEQATWDIDALGDALSAAPEPIVDVAFGGGVTYAIGPEPQLHLAVFPDSGVARLSALDAQVSLHRQSPPQIAENGVVFERHYANHHLTLAVMPEGNAILTVGTKDYREPLEGLTEPQSIPDSPMVRQVDETAVNDDSVASEASVEEPVQGTSKRPLEKQPRRTLQGRVGATPSFRTRPSGTIIGQFPLGVHEDDDTTTWHTIVAFDERAEKLKGSLKKGQAVEVIGYVHMKEQKGKDGQAKQVEEIYATVIKQR